MIDTPPYCRIEAKLDNPKAAWYVPNSVNIADVVPIWTVPGGGRLREHMTDSLDEAIQWAIARSELRMAGAEQHKRKLIRR